MNHILFATYLLRITSYSRVCRLRSVYNNFSQGLHLPSVVWFKHILFMTEHDKGLVAALLGFISETLNSTYIHRRCNVIFCIYLKKCLL